MLNAVFTKTDNKLTKSNYYTEKEKIIISDILSLIDKGNNYYYTNQGIGKKLGINKQYVKKLISKLFNDGTLIKIITPKSEITDPIILKCDRNRKEVRFLNVNKTVLENNINNKTKKVSSIAKQNTNKKVETNKSNDTMIEELKAELEAVKNRLDKSIVAYKELREENKSLKKELEEVKSQSNQECKCEELQEMVDGLNNKLDKTEEEIMILFNENHKLRIASYGKGQEEETIEDEPSVPEEEEDSPEDVKIDLEKVELTELQINLLDNVVHDEGNDYLNKPYNMIIKNIRDKYCYQYQTDIQQQHIEKYKELILNYKNN